jgi:biopolymer transport protein ExbB/TolQ
MEINLAELWSSMGLPVRCVVVLLTIQAVACVAVVIDRLVALTQSKARAREFVQSVEQPMARGDYEQVLTLMKSAKPNHLTGYLQAGLQTFVGRLKEGDSVARAAELANRELARRGEVVSLELNRGMNVLASTGSTAPFVGLLGTVLGIINAFKLIAATGSGGIGTIGAAIGEALVVTGYGLVVAIPSVLIFNYLSNQIAQYERRLVNGGSEFVDRLENGRGGSLATARERPAEDFVAAPVTGSAG